MTATTTCLTRERRDLLEILDKHRGFLRYTSRGLTDAQAALTPSVSALSIGGVIKHVTAVESGWTDFVLEGPAAMATASADWEDENALERHLSGFEMLAGETLAGLLADYEAVARRTDALVASLPDLDLAQALPAAPWFEPGAEWSARRVLLHIVAETAQHAGHADIIRESIDGQKTMG